MKDRNTIGTLFALLLWLQLANSQQANISPAPVQPGTTLSFSPAVTEIVKLSQSRLGDDVILAYIRNSQAPYRLSSDGILKLKDLGVSSPVISAMVSHDQTITSQPPPPSTVPPVATSPPPEIPNAPSVPPANTLPAAPVIAPTNAMSPLPLRPAPTRATVIEQAPPVPRVEIVPVATGPQYYWVPGYWAWNGGWVWVSGRWIVKPWQGAVWINGYWARHGRGYVWIGGRWR